MLVHSPHHRNATWMLVNYLYEGLSLNPKRLVESMCNGFFLTKNGDEAMTYLNQEVEMPKGWEVSKLKEMDRARPQSGPKGDMYQLDEDMALDAKVAQLSRKLEELESKGMHEVKAMQINNKHKQPTYCSTCFSNEHIIEECPYMPLEDNHQGGQANYVDQYKPLQFRNSHNFGNIYNPNWRNHPNLSWKTVLVLSGG